ncbi:MAG: hypothetical protein AB7O62_23135 [Pirellulales bacterium]
MASNKPANDKLAHPPPVTEASLPRWRIIPTVVLGLYASLLSFLGSVVLVGGLLDMWHNEFELTRRGSHLKVPLGGLLAWAAAIAWVGSIHCWQGRWIRTSNYLAGAAILGLIGLLLSLAVM